MYSCHTNWQTVKIKLYLNLLTSLKKKKVTDCFIFNMVLTWFSFYLIAVKRAKPFILPNKKVFKTSVVNKACYLLHS